MLAATAERESAEAEQEAQSSPPSAAAAAATLTRTSSSQLAAAERTARLSAEAQTLRIEAQEAADEEELRRTLSDIAIAAATSPKDAARLAAELRTSSELRRSSKAPPAPTLATDVPEGVPRKGPSYLVVTHTRFSRRITATSFADRDGALTAFNDGSKVDSRLLLEVDTKGQVEELQAWAIVREAVRSECISEARRWLEREEFRLMERPDDGGKQGWVEKQSGRSFMQEGRWERQFLSIRDRVLVAHDAEDAVDTAPLMALPAKDCVLGPPKSERKDRPHSFRIDVTPNSLQRAASDEHKLIFDPLSEDEKDAWMMAMGRAGAEVPDTYREKIYIEGATDKLPRGGIMDWISVQTDPTRPNAPWEKLWCEWKHPMISLHKTPGTEPTIVIDVGECELVGPADERLGSGVLLSPSLSRTSSAQTNSTDDLDRAFAWVLKPKRGTTHHVAQLEAEPEPEPEPEDLDGFEMVDAPTGSWIGMEAGSPISWIGMAAASGQQMRAWVTALGVLGAAHALPAARASKHLKSSTLNALLIQYGISERLDLAGEEFLGMGTEEVKELIELCPQVCTNLEALFVPESISRAHWDMFKEGLPQLKRIVRGITVEAHDGIVAQAQHGTRLDLTGPEYAKTTITGLLTLRGVCAHIESIFFVKDREFTNSTFPRGPFCICNPESGKMIRLRGVSLEAVHDEGQVWEYNPRTKQLEDKDTQLVLTLSGSEVAMRIPTGEAGQEWLYREEDKAIVNPSSGTVLDIAGGVDGTRLIGHPHHGQANQKWTLLHDDDTGGRHNIQDASAVVLSDAHTEQLKDAKSGWPKLQVAFLGREISAQTFDEMMSQYHDSGRIDLTGDQFANLSGLGMLELCELCPKPSRIFLHSKHPFSTLHIKAVKHELKIDDSAIVVRDIKLSDCVRLKVKQAAAVDQRTVETMVTPRSLPDQLELQEDLLERQSSRRSCFRCDGTGLIRESRSAVTISFATLEESTDEVTCSWLYKDANNSWVLYDKGTTVRLEREWRDAAAITDGQPPVVQLHQGDRVMYEVDMKAMTQTNVITGIVRDVKRADEAFGQAGHPCWVCRGSGSTTKWLKEFDSQLAEQEQDCMICYDEASFGLSTECGHFYCESCIQRSLEAMMDTAQFPAFCPQCRVDANDAGEELKVGRILPDALSFLEQRKVITKDFLFRFQKQNANSAEEEKYFSCPAKCGRFLIEEPVEFRTDKAHGIPVMRLGACPCGACICLQCKLEEHSSAATHQCPSVEGGDEIDAASLALVAKAGKKCPKCKTFVQRTEGCHVMMCGTNAHGKVAEALRNGGCAHIFDWNTLLSLNDGYGFTEMDGSKGRGNPLTARQLPKDEQKKCERAGCPFMFHADPKMNAGAYCCSTCKAGGAGHASSCHRILHVAPAKAKAVGDIGGNAGGDVGFTNAHDTIELTQGGILATKLPSPKQYQAAFCTDIIMGEVQTGGKKKRQLLGKHSATFTVMSGTAVVGLASPEVLQASEWRPGGAEGGATCGEQGWGYLTIGGIHKHKGLLSDWAGQQGAKQGDEITLYLDLDEGELWVALKKAALDAENVMLGRMVDGLKGPLIWMVELCNEGASVSIKTHARDALAPTSFINLPVMQHQLKVKLPKYRCDTKDEEVVVDVSSSDTWSVVLGRVQERWGIPKQQFGLELSASKLKDRSLAAGDPVGLIGHPLGKQKVAVKRNLQFDLAKAAKFLQGAGMAQEPEPEPEPEPELELEVEPEPEPEPEPDGSTGLLDASQALIGLASIAPSEARKHTDIINALIDALPHVNYHDKFGSTALMEAADKGNSELVSLLLKKGAEVEALDTGNRTALHWAAMRGHSDVVEQLIATRGMSHGITAKSFSTESKKGYTPSALAKKHEKVVRLLDEAMASVLVEEKVEPAYIVTGAGTAVCNGAYLPVGDKDGVPSFRNGDVLLFRYALGKNKQTKYWYLSDPRNLDSKAGDYYRLQSSDDTPPLSGWKTDKETEGKKPPPSIAKGPWTQRQ